MKKSVLLLLVFFSLQSLAADQLLNGRNLDPVSLQQALSSVRPGDIVVLGEQHGTTAQPVFQLQLMEALRKKGLKVSLGMEFFEYPGQAFVNEYRSGTLSESDFLKNIKWGHGFPFTSYRQQVLFPKLGEEYVVALNAPLSLTGKIAKTGLASLTDLELSLMPSGFTQGNLGYKERFKDIMGDHLPNPAALDNYFAAQSTWDDTMSWRANLFLSQHPEQVLVIIVGEFHVQYGGGLPDRLKARGANSVTKFSLVNLNGLTSEQVSQELQPSNQYGERADYIWAAQYAN